MGHIHHLAGIECAGCHENPEVPAPLKTGDCLSCHGSASEIAGQTAGQEPNPHDSIHYGPYLDCGLCHHVHRESENFCNQCHEYTFVVP